MEAVRDDLQFLNLEDCSQEQLLVIEKALYPERVRKRQQLQKEQQQQLQQEHQRHHQHHQPRHGYPQPRDHQQSGPIGPHHSNGPRPFQHQANGPPHQTPPPPFFFPQGHNGGGGMQHPHSGPRQANPQHQVPPPFVQQQSLPIAGYPGANVYINNVTANVNLVNPSMPPNGQQSQQQQSSAGSTSHSHGASNPPFVPPVNLPPGSHPPPGPLVPNQRIGLPPAATAATSEMMHIHAPPAAPAFPPPPPQSVAGAPPPVGVPVGGVTAAGSYFPPPPFNQPPIPTSVPSASGMSFVPAYYHSMMQAAVAAAGRTAPGSAVGAGAPLAPPPTPMTPGPASLPQQEVLQAYQMLQMQQIQQMAQHPGMAPHVQPLSSAATGLPSLPQEQSEQPQVPATPLVSTHPPPTAVDNLPEQDAGGADGNEMMDIGGKEPDSPDAVIKEDAVLEARPSDVATVAGEEEPVVSGEATVDDKEKVEDNEAEAVQNLPDQPEVSAAPIEAVAEAASTPVEEQPKPKPSTWASLFHNKAAAAAPASADWATASSKPTATVSPFSVSDDFQGAAAGPSSPGDDRGSGPADTPVPVAPVAPSAADLDLVEFLKWFSPNHKSPSLRPRGLSNRSNWCFVNAILQALTACPPFFNFINSCPLPIIDDGTNKWVILRAVWEFIKGVEVMGSFPKLNRRDKNKKSDDLPLGKTVEATSVFNMLLNLKSDNFKVIEGRQEDAEEFLTFLLNGLNDDALAILKLLDEKKEEGGEPGDAVGGTEEEREDVSGAGEQDDWKEVGPKKKSCITRRTITRDTPVATLFQGQIRSCVQHSAGQPTATLQPFFTLQLDIQSESVRSVSDALENNFATEALDGYVCATTRQEVDASRHLSLDQLPPILVLHLKRFVYDETSGGCQKLLKNIDFPVNLEVRNSVLSPSAKSRYSNKEKMYKLFAVVYHNGQEATKGHYVTDLYHTGLASWLRCDDSQVRVLPESIVLSHAANSLPYILFYRRGDTMSPAASGMDKPQAKFQQI